MPIVESLKRFRKSRGLIQKDIADVLGTTQSSYAQYEQKDKPSAPSIDVVIKLANTYQVSLDYLAGLTDDPRPVSQILAEMQNQKKSEDYDTKKEIQEIKSRLEKIETALACQN